MSHSSSTTTTQSLTRISVAMSAALLLALILLIPVMTANDLTLQQAGVENDELNQKAPALSPAVGSKHASQSATPQIPAAAVLSVVKRVTTDSALDGSLVRNGDTITYTITITNTTDQAVGVDLVKDVLPPSALLNPHCSGTGDTNCTLNKSGLSFPIISGPITDADKILISDTLVSAVESITWGNFSLGPFGSAALQFVATVGCQPDQAVIQNQADVTFAGGYGFASSNKTATLVEFKPNQAGSGQPLFTGPSWCSAEQGGVFDQDWSDFDLDGDLDLALATINGAVVYANDGGGTFTRQLISSHHNAFGVRWGDLAGDDRLELIVVGDYLTTTAGTFTGLNYIYTPEDNFSSPQATFETDDILWRADLADVDGNGQLELAAASYFGYLGYPYPTKLRHKYSLCLLRLFNYDSGGHNFIPGDCLIGPLPRREDWTSVDQGDTHSIIWGDVNDDDALDLLEGNYGAFNRWYRNNGSSLSGFSNFIDDGAGSTTSNGRTRSLAGGDFDQDGGFDLAVGNDGQANQVQSYAGGNWASKWPLPLPSDDTYSVAWGNRAVPDRDASIPVADDTFMEYTLPFTFPFGIGSPKRQIVKISVNTNGSIELLEAGEHCIVCGYWGYAHPSSIYNLLGIDAIFGLSADLYTGAIIEALPETNPSRVEITWMGTTYSDSYGYFDSRPNLFKVILHQNGQIEWKLFDIRYVTIYYGDFYAGLHDAVYGDMPVSFNSGRIPSGTQKLSFVFNGSAISGPMWDNQDQSIGTAINGHMEYSLPFTLPYFGRSIERASINTHGLVELLELGDGPIAFGNPNSHVTGVYSDAIFAANDNLKTWVFVEGGDNQVAITWMGTTAADDSYGSSGFRLHELAYKVILLPTGEVRWKFFDMNYRSHAGDLFSGVYAVAPPETELEVPDGTPSGYGIKRKFKFVQAPQPAIRPWILEQLILAVGNYGQPNYLYEPNGSSLQNSPFWTSTDSRNTTALAWGDYNNDGHADLAVGNYEQPIQIYRGDGGSDVLASSPAWTSTLSEKTRGLAWADWDGDGDLDLAVANEGGVNRVYETDQDDEYRLKNGDGFGWTSNDSDNSRSVAWADVDLDLDLDLVVANDGQANKLYRNDGGRLAGDPAWVLSDNSQSRGVAWGDVDRDGDLDLAVGNDGPPQVYYNRTLFKDGEGQIRRIGWIRDLSWADYDNDGDPDLAIGGTDLRYPGGGFVYILKNEAGLDYDDTNRLIQVAAGIDAEAYDLAWGDFNRDGWLDLAATFPTESKIYVYQNQDGTGFAPEALLDQARAFALDWVDIRRDGWLDLVAADTPPKVYLNDNGGLVDSLVLDSDAITGTIFSLRGVDADGDGDLDLNMANLADRSLLFSSFSSFLNRGLTPAANFAATGVMWGDQDGDGYLDLLFGGLGGDSRLYRNQGQAGPGFSLYKTFPGTGRRTAIFGDANGDGDLDVADGVLGGQAYLYLGDNNSPAWSSDPDAYALAWGDVNADGELDLLVGGSNLFASPHQLFINQRGPDLFDSTPSWTSQETEHTTSLAWGDYDNDNRLDFAAANAGQPTRIYRNNGDNTFSVAWSSPGGWDARAVAWADYDGDGDLDLAIGNYNQPNYLYRNDGGTFSEAWHSAVSAATTALAWGDWDNNGRPDLAVGNAGQPDRVYANFSSPGFTHLLWLWQSAEAYPTTGVAWGDQDGDGDLDLAISQSDAQNPNGTYENGYVSPAHLDGFTRYMPTLNTPAYLHVDRPGRTDAAYFFSSSEVLTGTTITTGTLGLTITYQVFDPDGTRNSSVTNADGDELLGQRTSYEYSTDGGGKWQPATAAVPPSPPITTKRQGQSGAFIWDMLADQVVNDDVRFRITIFDKPQQGTVQRIRTSTLSPPFRVSSLTCQWPEGAWIKVAPDLVTYTVGSSIRFEGYVVAGSGHLTFTWTFSDASAPVNSQVLHHQFDTPGDYLVTLTVSGEPCPTTREVAASRGLVVSGPPVMTYTLYLPLIIGDGGASAGPVSSLGLIVPGAPGQPAHLIGHMHAGGTTLEWTASSNAGPVLGYRVYRAPRSGSQPFHLLATLPAAQTSYTDRGTICGQAYLITAYNQAGESLPSTTSYLNRPCN